MSGAANWSAAFPRPLELIDEKRRAWLFLCRLGRSCAADLVNTPRYLLRYGVLVLAAIGFVHVWAATGDGPVPAILCHEHRHSRQRFVKTLSYAFSFLFVQHGDSSIVENDALLYEQEACAAIFGRPGECG